MGTNHGSVPITGASAGIERFGADTSRWMVAVRMVSEGVDVPRLAVGVWATMTSTPLFFAQAVGRVVRSRAPHGRVHREHPPLPVHELVAGVHRPSRGG
mgnify:CR=1 FL=1